MGERGQITAEYLLVTVLVFLGLAAAFYRPGREGRTFGGEIVEGYHQLFSRIAKP